MRVLIIDSDDEARALLSGTLARAGMDVFELPSPIGATKTMGTHEIGVAVLDLGSDERSVDKVARLLRSGRDGELLGIVLVTEEEDTSALRHQREMDADAVVPKARIKTHLVSAVRQAGARPMGSAPSPLPPAMSPGR